MALVTVVHVALATVVHVALVTVAHVALVIVVHAVVHEARTGLQHGRGLQRKGMHLWRTKGDGGVDTGLTVDDHPPRHLYTGTGGHVTP